MLMYVDIYTSLVVFETVVLVQDRSRPEFCGLGLEALVSAFFETNQQLK